MTLKEALKTGLSLSAGAFIAVGVQSALAQASLAAAWQNFQVVRAIQAGGVEAYHITAACRGYLPDGGIGREASVDYLMTDPDEMAVLRAVGDGPVLKACSEKLAGQ